MESERIPALVIITTSFPIVGDGSEAAGSFVVDLVEEMAKHLPVRVVAPGRSAQKESWSTGVEVYRYAAPDRPLSTLKFWRARDLWWLVRVLSGGRAATRAATAEPTAHILALWGLPSGDWARRVAFERAIDYSVWLLGSDVWTLGKVPVIRGVLAKAIRGAAHAYADGYVLADDALRLSGATVDFLPSTRRIGLIERSTPRGGPPYRLLFLGRWHPNKGVDLLLEALELLGDDDWGKIERMDIQGGGPLEGLVRAKVSKLEAMGRPITVGRYLTKSEAEMAIADSDWILIPSRIESIPVVFSDAAKLARPIVAMPVGDLPRLMSRYDIGHLASAVTAKDFAAALVGALRDEAVRFDLALHEVAAHFSMDNRVVRTILAGFPERAAGIDP